ncbi:MAG: hypothetical protein WDN45_14100 [Caulobacteraceae bacterium]
MISVVSSSSAAALVSPASSEPDAPDAETSTQTTPASPSASTPPGGAPVLSDDAMAALVAQQAADGSSSAAPAPDPDQVQIPPAVLANMKAFQTTAPTAYTDQISQLAATINDAKAADQDRLNAWTTLNGLLYSGTIYKAGNLADFQTALNAVQTSGHAKSLMQMQDQFHTANVINADAGRAKGVYGPQPLLDTLNSYSPADQQKLFILMGLNQSYSDLASMKSAYQQVADTYAASAAQAKTDDPSASSAPAVDENTALALKTLQAVNDQIAAARKGGPSKRRPGFVREIIIAGRGLFLTHHAECESRYEHEWSFQPGRADFGAGFYIPGPRPARSGGERLQ